MLYKLFFFNILSFTLTLFLFLVGFCFLTSAQVPSSLELFKSSEYTPPNSFTHGVEGPAVDKYGTVYAVNFSHQGTIGMVTPSAESSVFIELPCGSIGNGIRLDSHGNMLIADYTMHNVLKVDMTTKRISFFAHEPKMTQPNDLAIDERDRIYASDPDFKANTGRIWRIDTDGKITLLDRLGPANGIEVSPDGRKLYVNTYRKVWSYDLSHKGELSNKHLLIEFTDFGTDGMRCDVEGNLYITRIGKGTIVKISPRGSILQEIDLIGKKPTNVAFGGKDGCTLYVTLMDQGNLESFRVNIPGREWKMQRDK